MAANDYKTAIRHYRKQNRIFALCAFSGAAMMIAAFLQPRVGEHLSQVNLFWMVITLSFALLISGPMIVAHNNKLIRILASLESQEVEEN